MAEGWRRMPRRPAYLHMLAAIVVSYALIIVVNEEPGGAPGRVILLGYLLWIALRLRGASRLRPWLFFAIGVALAATVWVDLVGPARATSALIGGLSFVAVATVIGTIARTAIRRGEVDTETVLGVLCVYLLLALLFASLNQFMASFDMPYLNGVSGLPTAADHLYFSVITMATVGYGDITPASQIARAVAVIEALTGQLYLVSVVAAVVGGWRRPPRSGS